MKCVNCVLCAQVTHDMLLNVLGRDTDGVKAMQHLVRDCHESPTMKRVLRRRAFDLARSLLERDIIEILPEPLASGARVRCAVWRTGPGCAPATASRRAWAGGVFDKG